MVAWVTGAAAGFAAGFVRTMIPFVFVVAGVGLAGTLAVDYGSVVFGFLDTEGSRTAALFLMVFMALQLVGSLISYLVRNPMSIVSTLVSMVPVGLPFNKGAGLAAGIVAAGIFVSVILIGLQQLPIERVGEGIRDSAIAREPMGWVDRVVAPIEISKEWQGLD